MPHCPACCSLLAPEDRFCGECGAPVAPAAEAAATEPRCACGAPATSVDAEGYCSECGRRTVAADPHDHAELSLSPQFAAVTDRGRRHAHNEDAVLIAEHRRPEGVYRLLTVSDGVSTSYQPQRASASAVEALRDAVFAALDAGLKPEAALEAACGAAQDAVCAIAAPDRDEPPAATLVAALVFGAQAFLAWAGDSRAYLLAPEPRQLTRDDSWLNAVVASGEMSAAEAQASRYAHAIVSCLGPLEEEAGFKPNFATVPLPPGATLLLCSDGLWNYAETAEEIAKLAVATDALAACRKLAAFANEAGGRDNISVAILASAILASDPPAC